MNYVKFSISLFAVVAFNCAAVLTAHADGEKLLRAAVAVDKDTEPATSFSSDVPQLYTFYIGQKLKAGDQLRGVWIAEDVGAAAPKNTKIDESSIAAASATDQGAFSLSKPTNGWPVGSYRVEIYDGDALADTVKFQITKAETKKKDADKDTDEDE